MNGPDSNNAEEAKDKESKKLKFLLEPARPPDAILGFPQWRWCHMGLILSANPKKKATERTSESPSLYIIVDL